MFPMTDSLKPWLHHQPCGGCAGTFSPKTSFNTLQLLRSPTAVNSPLAPYGPESVYQAESSWSITLILLSLNISACISHWSSVAVIRKNPSLSQSSAFMIPTWRLLKMIMEKHTPTQPGFIDPSPFQDHLPRKVAELTLLVSSLHPYSSTHCNLLPPPSWVILLL